MTDHNLVLPRNIIGFAHEPAMEDPRSQSLGSRGAQYTKLSGHSGYGSTGGRHDGDLEKEGDDDPDAYPAASPCCRSNRECCCCFFGCCCSFSTVLIIVGLVYFVIARAKPIHHTVQVRFYIFFHTSLSHVWTRYWEGERGSIRMGVATASAEHARAHCAFLSVAHSSLPAPPRPHRVPCQRHALGKSAKIGNFVLA